MEELSWFSGMYIFFTYVFLFNLLVNRQLCNYLVLIYIH